MKSRCFGAVLLSIIILLLSACGQPAGVAPPAVGNEGAPSGLTVYFLDVGQADSALVVCDGAAMLIDGGNAADSSLVYAFLEGRGVTHLDVIVATHRHEDHVGGLAGALNFASVGIAYCPVEEYDSKAFSNFVKYLGEQGKAITVPRAGDAFALGGAYVEIVAPVREYDNPNNASIVLKLTYGEVSFLFTGDCERESEADILDAGFDVSATVLKVAHHGSDTSTSYPFLREVMPEFAVISVGANNQYGHPNEDTLSKLRDADVVLYRTDLQGTVTATSDGKAVAFEVERNASEITNPTQAADAHEYYIGNANTRKLHSPACSSLPDEKNRVYFDTLEEAFANGYDAHSVCLR